MTIRVLPQNLINQIAAGEVVERPASALKELIENAIDAGSTQIDIKLADGGKSYFSVSDNGCGMTQEELSVAVERHATSKLEDENLFNIHFLGFRGEALPSIGSVSHLKIISRTKESDSAWSISIDGGKKSEPVPDARGQGTTVEVRDLFYATPARLKFLKSPQTELSYMKEIVNRLAMAYPHIGFSLSDERKTLLNYPISNSLFKRVSSVIGKSFDENALPLQTNYEEFSLSGFVGLPTYTRATGTEQYLYVNGRFIRDKILISAIRGAYQGLIGHDTYPVLALFLDVPPKEVDVNVHPAKTEVRFKDSGKIRGFLIGSIRNTLMSQAQKTASTLATETLSKSYPNILKTHPFEKNAFTQKNRSSYSTNSSSSVPEMTQEKISFGQAGYGVKTSYVEIQKGSIHSFEFQENPLSIEQMNLSRQFSQESHQQTEIKKDMETDETVFPPLGFAKTQLHKTYIVSQTRDSIIIVDQHAAHERLTYEKLFQEVQNNPKTQLLLIPEIIDLKPEEVSCLIGRAEELKSFGFVVDPFGADSVAVREIPALLYKTDLKKLIQDLVDTIKEYDDTIALKDRIKEICARMACHGSIRAGRDMTIDEMNVLLRQMESCGTSAQCIHGRPTYIELKLSDVERLFGRSK